MDSQTSRIPVVAASYVVSVIIAIGIYDAYTGLTLLLSDTPGLVNGTGTVWADPATVNGLTLSLFERIGAFSLHVGVVTMVLGWYSMHHAVLRTVLLLTYFFTGLVFAWHDFRWFAYTDYWYLKQVIGTGFFTALVIQLYGSWKGWWKIQVPSGPGKEPLP